MTNRTRAGIVLLVLASGLAGGAANVSVPFEGWIPYQGGSLAGVVSSNCQSKNHRLTVTRR